MMQVDVALVPQIARPDEPAVFIVIDEIRASTTLTTLLDLDCSPVYVEGSLDVCRRLKRRLGATLVGERRVRLPAGFDYMNSPMQLVAGGLRGGCVAVSTSNGTAMLKMLRRSEHVLVGCLRNARACGEAAVALAQSSGAGIRIVCAGRLRRFVLEDALAAGVVVDRIVAAAGVRGIDVELTDAAAMALRLPRVYPDTLQALTEADGGRVLRAVGQGQDLPFCAEIDVTATVPVLRDGNPMRIERLSF